VLHVEEIDLPRVGAGEVLLRVHAAGLDRGTWHLMTGLPYLVRLAFGLRRPKQPVPGRDIAGTVVAVGTGVTRFEREDKLAHKPASLTFDQAAVLVTVAAGRSFS
jgi:NADPH:quinone reductase-like Zn-dependent oxidoreductase